MDQEKVLTALLKACSSMTPELQELYQDFVKESQQPKEGEEKKDDDQN